MTHVRRNAHVLGDALSFFVDEPMARQAGAVVELLPADVAGVYPPLSMQAQVTPEHPAAFECHFAMRARVPLLLHHWLRHSLRWGRHGSGLSRVCLLVAVEAGSVAVALAAVVAAVSSVIWVIIHLVRICLSINIQLAAPRFFCVHLVIFLLFVRVCLNLHTLLCQFNWVFLLVGNKESLIRLNYFQLFRG